MADTELKYDLLDSLEKREVQDFIEFLLSKRRPSERPGGYKDLILSVSVWNDEDVRLFGENDKLFNHWKPSEW